MLLLVRTIGAGAIAGWLATAPAVSQLPPQQVTSDTQEYCLYLLDRVSEMARGAGSPPPDEVISLSSEGQRMCDQGRTRGGILRLRRALILMMHQHEGP
jgi:hypothetical protein